MSQFESEIKQLLDNYEGPVDSNAWSDMEQKMNAGNSTSFFKQFAVAGTILTAVMIGLSVDYNAGNAEHLADNANHGIIESFDHNAVSSNSNIHLNDVLQEVEGNSEQKVAENIDESVTNSQTSKGLQFQRKHLFKT